MKTIDLLKARRAIRNYENRKVEKEKIEYLLEAATLAPTDRLREPWSFYVIQDEAKERYEELAKEFLLERFPTKPNLVESSLKVVSTTPVMIIVTSDLVIDDEDASEDNEYAVCCAIHSMWLAASELGLGFVWRTRGVGLVRDSRLHTFIGAPENKKIIGTIFLGYPDKEALNSMKPSKRTPYHEKTVWL
ncbi:nitroreductase family protein [Halalkalibacterium ligniniphilum]|uniref:nitroreductase family protein n=1 Tax=Halalkalibacterium ligniniphilum TaxID=1134413 RepID=UPI0004774E38|nr:nitroreductase [Halalkalibacterium ligniniphilum]